MVDKLNWVSKFGLISALIYFNSRLLVCQDGSWLDSKYGALCIIVGWF